MAGQTKAHGGHKAAAAARRHREQYNKQGKRTKNKLHRIRRSNGIKACRAYAAARGMSGWAREHGLIN